MAKRYEKKEILVYAHWQDLTGPVRMGTLIVTQGKGKEVFSFEYTADWLKSGFTQLLDPDLTIARHPDEDAGEKHQVDAAVSHRQNGFAGLHPAAFR